MYWCHNNLQLNLVLYTGSDALVITNTSSKSDWLVSETDNVNKYWWHAQKMFHQLIDCN